MLDMSEYKSHHVEGFENDRVPEFSQGKIWTYDDKVICFSRRLRP